MVPSKRSFPLLMMPTCVHIFSISLSRWLETKIVTPFSWLSLMSSFRISIIPFGSKPFTGSSKSNNSGSLNKAMAIARRCFIPSEYCLALRLPSRDKSTNSNVSWIFASGMLRSLAMYFKLSIPLKCR